MLISIGMTNVSLSCKIKECTHRLFVILYFFAYFLEKTCHTKILKIWLNHWLFCYFMLLSRQSRKSRVGRVQWYTFILPWRWFPFVCFSCGVGATTSVMEYPRGTMATSRQRQSIRTWPTWIQSGRRLHFLYCLIELFKN